MLIGSLAGPLCAGGGFCAGSEEVVEHQRISAAAYTFSAALPAIASTTASETIRMRQENEGLYTQLKENIKIVWKELESRSNFDMVRITSVPENPVILVALKDEIVESKKLSQQDQETIFQDIIDECISNGVLITRLKAPPHMLGASAREEKKEWQPRSALKVCMTLGLQKKEIEKAGREIRHAVRKCVNNYKK
jgi:serine palmitoyltransferase